MPKARRPKTADEIRVLAARKARKELQDKIWTWFVILIFAAMVLFTISQVFVHHF